jgi:hypothetical protein
LGFLLLLLLLPACGAPVAEPTLSFDGETLVVRGGEITSIVVRDADGGILVRRDAPGPMAELSLRHGAPAGTLLRVGVQNHGETYQIEGAVPRSPGPLSVEIELPTGGGAEPLGSTHPFTTVEGAAVQAALVLVVAEPGPVDVVAGSHTERVDIRVSGERRVVFLSVPGDRATPLRIRGGGQEVAAVLSPRSVSREEARTQLVLRPLVVPAEPDGTPARAWPAGRVTLPAAWWRGALQFAGLGTRARDPHAPWAFQALTLENRSAFPLHVAIDSCVKDASGAPAPAFFPHQRGQDGGTGTVAALLRIPAKGEATAVLPLFVDGALVPEGSSTFRLAVGVTPLGAKEPLLRQDLPLQVRRGSSWVSLGFALGLLAGALGLVVAAVRLPRRLASLRTVEIVTVAVFATLSFVVAGASTVLAGVLSALLGPFTLFVTALVEDVLRYALLATLLLLLPRRGIATLHLVVLWLLRAVALGAFGPLDLLFLGAQALFVESSLHLAGCTRAQPGGVAAATPARWRLALALGIASILSSASGLLVSMVAYRLYYASWYVLAVLIGPGFLYVLASAWVGGAFARSLRAVDD